MRFNPIAFLVLVVFFGLLTFALSSGSSTFHISEAIVTVLIVIGISFALRRQRL
jgi:hypothetical protein